MEPQVTCVLEWDVATQLSITRHGTVIIVVMTALLVIVGKLYIYIYIYRGEFVVHVYTVYGRTVKPTHLYIEFF